MDQNQNRKGLLVTFNLIKRREKGSMVDENNIHSTFRKIGFEIDNPNCKRDFTKVQLMKNIENFMADHDKELPRIIVIMTHGSDDYLEDVNRDSFHVNTVINMMSATRHPQLRDTLKLLVVLACRRNNYPAWYTDSSNHVNTEDHKNLIVAFSCTKKMGSFRGSKGSPFIQIFCKCFYEEFQWFPLPLIMEDMEEQLSAYKKSLRSRKTWTIVPEIKYIGSFARRLCELPILGAIKAYMHFQQNKNDAISASQDNEFKVGDENRDILVHQDIPMHFDYDEYLETIIEEHLCSLRKKWPQYYGH